MATADEEISQAIAQGVAEVNRYRRELDRTLRYVATHPQLFPLEKFEDRPPRTTAQRQQVRQAWQNLLDHIVALDALKAGQSRLYKETDRPLKDQAFAVLYAAFLCQYRYALVFLQTVENDPTLDVVLNEADPELGLMEDTYGAFKFRFLNVAIATQFVAMNTLAVRCKAAFPADLASGIAQDKAYIWRMGKGKGEALTFKNALTIIQGAGFSAWFPVQQGVSQWMGATKVWRRHKTLVSSEQIDGLPDQLQPGDILLERREWYMSNVGLPGFWPHVALYVGTAEERAALFDGDPEVQRWLWRQGVSNGRLETLLRTRYPAAYADATTPRADGHLPRIVEATGEGVCLTTLAHSAACDSLAALRPRLSGLEKARAITRAFHYQGRPYDFNFDFLTDAALVCSELVYKCYEPSGGFTGIVFPLVDMLGRQLTPPNDMVRQFDAQWGTPGQQTDLVLFYDGHEPSGKALPADIEAFRTSWRRPKWHILLQKANPPSSPPGDTPQSPAMPSK